jgi:thiol:disulfide interchange protein
MRSLLLCLLLLVSPAAFAASSVTNEHSTATLTASHDGVVTGGETEIGLVLQHQDGWHTYWENPGDAGIPTTMEFTLPDGVTAGPVQWPLPIRMMEGELAIYGYEGTILLPVTLKVAEGYGAETIPVKLKASWLICHNICIPESAELELTLPVKTSPSPSDEFARFTGARSAMPEALDAPLAYAIKGDTIELKLPDGISTGGDAYFFPREYNHILYAAEQTVTEGVLTLPRDPNGEKPEALSGYLVADGHAYDIKATKTGILSTGKGTASGEANYIALLFFAMLGGLILNLMPCVLPVLSLKAIAIAKKSAHDRHVIVAQALAYTAGIIISFAVIALLLISLQQAGEQIGWGFQMQSPPFVGFLTVLLFLVGLNLAGMFELPVLFGSALSDTRQHNLRGSFLTGVLATAVATPCTAPFMATAVGATLTLPAVQSFFIFIMIGLGLALPFLLIAVFPWMITFLPRPGKWMETFKQLMAFPMFASVVWLVWVLTQQGGADALLIVLITLLVLTFLIWLQTRCRDRSPLCKIAIILVMLSALFNGLSALSKVNDAMIMPEEHRFSESRLSELRDKGTPVFVDATAAWCLTCQVNKKVAIDTAASRAAFDETGTQLLIADWTNRDPEITSFLKRFGYNGVPLYVYFPAGGEPVVLPQVLSETKVIQTLKGQ